jgi:hypothetical protein
MTKSANYFYKVSNSRLLRPILSNVFLALGIHWFFQCVLEMDRTERYFKIAMDAILTILFSLVLIQWLSSIPSICLGWILAHTINFLLNGQAFVVLKHFGDIRNQADEIEKYISSMKIRMVAEASLQWAGIYGSLSRGEMKETSDLDVRVIRYPGLVNGFRACFFVMGERIRAHVNRFPLDILLLDSPRLLKYLRPDEPPIVIYDASDLST